MEIPEMWPKQGALFSIYTRFHLSCIIWLISSTWNCGYLIKSDRKPGLDWRARKRDTVD